MKNILLAAIPFLVVVGGIFVIVAVTTNGKDASRYNLALNRVQLCILSVPAEERTIDDIEHCYRTIEDELDTNLVRDIEKHKNL